MARYGREFGMNRGGMNRGGMGRGGMGRGGMNRGSDLDYGYGAREMGGQRGREGRGFQSGGWGGRSRYDMGYQGRGGYDRDIGDRLRAGWRDVRETARDWMGRGGRRGYDRGW